MSSRARVFSLHRTCYVMYFPVSDVPRALLHVMLTVRVRVPRGGAPDGHDVEIFVRRDYHHDIQTLCYTIRCAIDF